MIYDGRAGDRKKYSSGRGEGGAGLPRRIAYGTFICLGQTGTGKSVSLQNMIAQDIENGDGVCMIDPLWRCGGAYSCTKIPKHRADDVVVFDPGDLEQLLGINILEYDPRVSGAETFIVNEMINIFDKLYDLKTTGGPMSEKYMRNALMLIMLDPEKRIHLCVEVPRVFPIRDFRKLKLSRGDRSFSKKFQAERSGKSGAATRRWPMLRRISPAQIQHFYRQ